MDIHKVLLGGRPVASRFLPFVAVVLSTSLLGCGGSEAPGESEPERASSNDPPAAKSSQAPAKKGTALETSAAAKLRHFDVDVELRGPARFIKGHPQLLPEWGDELRVRIDPEMDESWSERVAVRFEASCELLMLELLAGKNEAAGKRTSPDFAGFTGLFPEFGEPRFDDGSFVVSDAQGSGAEPESLAALAARLAKSEWSGLASPQAIPSLVDLQAAGEGLWKGDLELRIVGELDGIPVMMDVEADVTLREGDGAQAAPLLASMSARFSRLIRRPHTTFKSISGLVLEDLPNWAREFGLGTGDYDRISDRRSIAFGTGMLGMALGDVDGNGLDDLYISMISGFPNRLLLHQADGSVIDGAAAAGVDILDTTRGGLLVDLDGDDDLDLCITRQSGLVIYWNDGKGKFDSPVLLNSTGDSPIYSVSAADPDLDGDLDLFCCRYRLGRGAEIVPTPFHNAANGIANMYWRNDGERNFTSAGEENGLTSGDTRYSFIALWEDFDDDGKLDLYVVNDFGPNNLYMNTGDGFEDRAAEMGILDASTGMGISAGDIDLDGDLDYYVTNIFSAPGLRAISEPQYRGGDEVTRALHRELADGMSLYVQESPGKYIERAGPAGADHGGWAWGAIFYDWNLDGYPDIYVPNGFISYENRTDVESFFWRWVVAMTPATHTLDENYNRNWEAISGFNRMEGFAYHGHERNHVFLNLGDGTFADVSAISDTDFMDDGRVAARTDWDNDGRQDLVLVSGTGPRLRIVRNAHPNPGHRVAIRLQGKLGSIDTISARIRVHRSDGKVVTQTVYAGEGLMGQSSYTRFFGLGKASGNVDVEVRWPDGEVQRFEDLAIDRGWKLHRTSGEAESWAFEPSPFENAPHSPAKRTPGVVHRAVLAEKMPLRYLTLQNADGHSLLLESLPKTPKLLTLWDPESRAGLALLQQLAESHQEILSTETILCPVAVEGGGGTGADVLETLGLAEYALNASKNDEMILEALLVELLNTYDNITLPLSLLLDAESNLCALYYGNVPTDDVLADLRLMKNMLPGDISTVALSGGYWLSRPERRYKQISRALMMLGARDLASDLKESKK